MNTMNVDQAWPPLAPKVRGDWRLAIINGDQIFPIEYSAARGVLEETAGALRNALSALCPSAAYKIVIQQRADAWEDVA